jgi:hypothetical protein
MNIVLILFIAFIITIAIYYYCERYYRRKALSAINNSNGTFDKHAQTAIDALDKIQSPNVQDRFLAGRLIDLNGHDGRINNVRVLNNVVDKYMGHLRPFVDGQPYEINNDNLEWFKLDQIENFADRHMDIMVANPHYNDFIDAVLQTLPKWIHLHTMKTWKSSRMKKINKKSSLLEAIVNRIQI